MRQILAPLVLCAATTVQADESTMIVLDASGSMWGQIDGVNKIVVAREVVRESLGAAPADNALGLLAYGHNRKGDCSDIELLVPPGAGQMGQVVAAVDGINPKGKTPLTEAVRQAAVAMRHQENKSTVVLVTDGLETCGADPCALARELEQSGLDFTAHVVGFGLSKQDGAAVSCLAAETGGRYFDAGNRGELAAALSLAVAQDITPETVIEEPPQVEPKHNLQINVQMSPDSPPLENGEIDKLVLDLILADGSTKNVGYSPVMAVKVAEGDYQLRAKYAGGEVAEPISIERFDTTHVTLVLNAGVVDFRAIPLSPELVPENIVTWRITDTNTGDQQFRFEPALRSVLAEGQYEVVAILGRKDATAPPLVRIDVTAGDVTEGEILLPHGGLAMVAQGDDGAALPHSFMRFGLWTAKEDGTPDQLVYLANDTKRPLLALPGDYVLVAEDWGIAKGGKRKLTRPISIAPGTKESVQITMPADLSLPMGEN